MPVAVEHEEAAAGDATPEALPPGQRRRVVLAVADPEDRRCAGDVGWALRVDGWDRPADATGHHRPHRRESAHVRREPAGPLDPLLELVEAARELGREV